MLITSSFLSELPADECNHARLALSVLESFLSCEYDGLAFELLDVDEYAGFLMLAGAQAPPAVEPVAAFHAMLLSSAAAFYEWAGRTGRMHPEIAGPIEARLIRRALEAAMSAAA